VVNLDVMCDRCGDITIAWYEITVHFPKNIKIKLNLCLDCYNEIINNSRKYKVAEILKILLGDGQHG